tara:strand:+ start:774 stop:1013 length:240 start_codon:yes stop_codon:yes gene_type:complete
MENEIDKKIKNIMANVFKVKIDKINNDTSPNSIEEWDSLKHLNLIVALEEEFEIKLDQDEIASMISFPIICATIQAYLD